MTVVVVGASLAGVRVAQALREGEWAEDITVVGEELHPPYDRPPLSKDFIIGGRDVEDLSLAKSDELDGLDIRMRLGTRACHVDDVTREVVTDSGERIAYSHLVIATGSRPRRPPVTLAGLHVLRTLDDAHAVRASLQDADSVLVIGAGLVGCEVAAACRKVGRSVTLLNRDAVPMRRALGAVVGELMGRRLEDQGVIVRHEATVRTYHGCGRLDAVELTTGELLPTHVAVVGIGAVPNTEWLRSTRVLTADGVVCDHNCRAIGHGNIYAVGDVCRYYDRSRRQYVRHEHWWNAQQTAEVVAANILGGSQEVTATPYFWSEQGGDLLQVYGLLTDCDQVEVLTDDRPDEPRWLALASTDGVLVGVAGLNSARALGRVRGLLSVTTRHEEALAVATKLVHASAS